MQDGVADDAAGGDGGHLARQRERPDGLEPQLSRRLKVDAARPGGKVDNQTLGLQLLQQRAGEHRGGDGVEHNLLLGQHLLQLAQGNGLQPQRAGEGQVPLLAGGDGDAGTKALEQQGQRLGAAAKAGDQAAALPQGAGALVHRKVHRPLRGGDGVEDGHLLPLKIVVDGVPKLLCQPLLGRGDLAAKEQRIRTAAGKEVAEGDTGFAERGVEQPVVVADRQREDDGVAAGKAVEILAAQLGRQKLRRPLDAEDPDGVPVLQKAFGQRRLTEVSADDAKDGAGIEQIHKTTSVGFDRIDMRDSPSYEKVGFWFKAVRRGAKSIFKSRPFVV